MAGDFGQTAIFLAFVNDAAFDHDDLVTTASPFAGQAHTGLRGRTKVAALFRQ
jgi:hypothetical protein